MDKYKIISIIFIGIIGIVGITTAWNNRQELIESIHSENMIQKINEIYETATAFKNEFLSIWSFSQNTMGAELLDDAEYGYIIKDDTGNLYFPADDEPVEQYAQNVIDFSNRVQKKNGKFAYIQAPNKVIKGYSSDMVFSYNYSNKNADEFLEIL